MIELIKIKGKSIDNEYNIINYLNKQKCVSCPKIYYRGKIDKKILSSLLTDKYDSKYFN